MFLSMYNYTKGTPKQKRIIQGIGGIAIFISVIIGEIRAVGLIAAE